MDSSAASRDSAPLHSQTSAQSAETSAAEQARWTEWWRSYMHTTRNLLQQQQVCVELLQLRVQDRPEARGWFTQLELIQDQLQHFHEAAYRFAVPLTLAYARTDLLALWSQAWLQAPLAGGERPRWSMQASSAERPQVWADRAALVQATQALLQLLVTPETKQVQLQVVPSANGRQGWESRLTVRPAALAAAEVEASFTPFARRPLDQCLAPAQAQRIVHAHGGRVRVSTADEQGVTIAVDLPEEPA